MAPADPLGAPRVTASDGVRHAAVPAAAVDVDDVDEDEADVDDVDEPAVVGGAAVGVGAAVVVDEDEDELPQAAAPRASTPTVTRTPGRWRRPGVAVGAGFVAAVRAGGKPDLGAVVAAPAPELVGLLLGLLVWVTVARCW